MYMKRLIVIAFISLVTLNLHAQTASRYEQRYDLLVSQFGPAGVGVETVLDNWAKVDSTNAKMLQGKFAYLFTKAQTAQVEPRPGKKYLGMDPVLTLKDSLGNDVNYFQINVFDDELYAEALKVADKAISFWPDRLDFRFMMYKRSTSGPVPSCPSWMLKSQKTSRKAKCGSAWWGAWPLLRWWTN